MFIYDKTCKIYLQISDQVIFIQIYKIPYYQQIEQMRTLIIIYKTLYKHVQNKFLKLNMYFRKNKKVDILIINN